MTDSDETASSLVLHITARLLRLCWQAALCATGIAAGHVQQD